MVTWQLGKVQPDHSLIRGQQPMSRTQQCRSSSTSSTAMKPLPIGAPSHWTPLSRKPIKEAPKVIPKALTTTEINQIIAGITDNIKHHINEIIATHYSTAETALTKIKENTVTTITECHMNHTNKIIENIEKIPKHIEATTNKNSEFKENIANPIAEYHKNHTQIIEHIEKVAQRVENIITSLKDPIEKVITSKEQIIAKLGETACEVLAISEIQLPEIRKCIVDTSYAAAFAGYEGESDFGEGASLQQSESGTVRDREFDQAVLDRTQHAVDEEGLQGQGYKKGQLARSQWQELKSWATTYNWKQGNGLHGFHLDSASFWFVACSLAPPVERWSIRD